MAGPIDPLAARLVRDRLTEPAAVRAKVWLTDRGPVSVKAKA